MLAQLQSANVRGDGPAVARRDLLAIGRHGPITARDHVEKVADRNLAQALDVIGRRRRIAALDDLSASRSKCIMTHHAIDHKAIVAMLENFARDREWKGIDVISLLRNGGYRRPKPAGMPRADNDRRATPVSRFLGCLPGEQGQI